MSDVFVKETLTGATFTDGTTLSGTYTVEYSPTGTLLGITAAHLVATGTSGSTTFESFAPIQTSANDPVNGVHYTIGDNDPSLSGPYAGLVLTFRGEDPTHLSVNLYDSETTEILKNNGSAAPTIFGLTSGGAINGNTVCFMAGTSISVPAGAAAVETLGAGDWVVTTEGEHRQIRWLGRQTVSTRFSDPLRVLPIRIRQGAFGSGLPMRDLLVSPDHALLLDGVLVQAGALVNGLSITQESQVPEVFTYYHIELADHSLILAEGVAAETFVDNVDRLGFDNWDEHEALGLDMSSIVEMPVPRAQSRRQVPVAIWDRLISRASEAEASALALVA
jgi:hypothetical protein